MGFYGGFRRCRISFILSVDKIRNTLYHIITMKGGKAAERGPIMNCCDVCELEHTFDGVTPCDRCPYAREIDRSREKWGLAPKWGQNNEEHR